MTHLEPTSARAIAGDATTPTTALAWPDAADRLAASLFVWFTTTRPDGAPHSRPVLSVWVDGRPHTTSRPGAVKARNLAANPRCSFSLTTDGMDVTLEGTAERVTDQTQL